MADVRGIDADGVTQWFTENIEGVTPPLGFELIAGGHSNLTYTVTDAAGERYVLRRPPLGEILATAHDMHREYRIISALGPTDVPVPPALGYCPDPSVNEKPFYVMAYVPGHVLRGAEVARDALDEGARRRAGHQVAEVLARIHAIDPDSVGLGDLGRKEGYIERQLRRWYGQWEQSKTRELDTVEEVYQRLSSNVPEQGPATIVHGDYRLDNCMFDGDGTILAVLDWELCTLGDPLADLGLLMVYWRDADDERGGGGAGTSATGLAGFPRKQELVDEYAAVSGRDVSDLSFYHAFGFWKLACIIEGVYARYTAGKMGSTGNFDGFARQVEYYAEAAKRLLDQA